MGPGDSGLGIILNSQGQTREKYSDYLWLRTVSHEPKFLLEQQSVMESAYKGENELWHVPGDRARVFRLQKALGAGKCSGGTSHQGME